MSNSTTTQQKPTLFERLGGEENVRKIVNDVLEKNSNNPLIAHHFKNIDMKGLKQKAFEFFSMGTGGPHQYTGRDMRTAHANMNINIKEYDSATDDTIAALDENGIGQEGKNEVLAILEYLKGDIVTK
ncbi:MAG TPA: group 1 truncated hemoglobin [Chitinophagaceae bacterium]|nr:group 1 truncated hemoglobin [Chitinophagaceae bacterium]